MFALLLVGGSESKWISFKEVDEWGKERTFQRLEGQDDIKPLRIITTKCKQENREALKRMDNIRCYNMKLDDGTVAKGYSRVDGDETRTTWLDPLDPAESAAAMEELAPQCTDQHIRDGYRCYFSYDDQAKRYRRAYVSDTDPNDMFWAE